MPQDFDQVYDYSLTPKEEIDPQDTWVRTYPIFMRTLLKDSTYRYTDTLVYLAGSEEKAISWCKRNTDIESHDNCWWFVITQEAIDGEFSGIRGVMQMLDWDGNEIDTQPLDGYKEIEVTEETK